MTAPHRAQTPPGPPPGPGETLDRLVGDWWIYQLKGGHRFSTDDLVAGWRAARVMPGAKRLLDLGSGIGSVGLYALGLVDAPDATLVGVEAQEISHALALRTVAANGLTDRVTYVRGDLRDPDVLPAGATFELVTGSPPYKPLGTGHVSPHPQRAACRMELRGSVVDYNLAARRYLAPGGRFVFVMAVPDARTEPGIDAAGLRCLHRLDVVFREGMAPMVAVYTCARQEDAPVAPVEVERLTIRGADRHLTPRYAALRAELGFPNP